MSPVALHSTDRTVHRALSLAKGGVGKDVHELQVAINARLHARGEEDYILKVDDVYGRKTARSASRALWLIGAIDPRMAASKVENGGHLSEGAQRMLRYPGRRSRDQLMRAERRFGQLKQARAEEARDALLHPNIAIASAAARLALGHAPQVHYTQLAPRWDGIRLGLVAARGQYPRHADCSSFYTWCLWQILGTGPDVVNGAGWTGGYTGTLLSHGRKVNRDVEGAAALYGYPGTTGKHVAYCLGHGMVISHGSEGGPYLLPLHYRADLMEIRAFL